MAQQSTFCENLQKVIAGAEKGDFINIRGKQNGNDFTSNVSLRSKGARIYKNNKAIFYEEQLAAFENSSNDSNKQVLFISTLNEVLGCLQPSEWNVLNEGETYSIKNLKSRAFMDLKKASNGVTLQVYKQEIPLAKCLTGDCANGFGTLQYENGDIYEGQFLNSQRIGMGKYIWTDKSRYEGSWLADTMNGYGLYFNAAGQQEKSSYLLLGNYVDIDSSNTDFCQYGNCQNGFGLYYYKDGAIYIGNFKDGLQNGLGLFESKSGIYYGQFANGKYNGTGIVFSTEGKVMRANFVNGVQVGDVVADKKPAKETSFYEDVLSGAEFNEYGILIKTTDPAGQKNVMPFAESLSKLYSYRSGKFGRIKGNRYRNKGWLIYESIVRLKGSQNTFIREEDKDTFVRAQMNATPLDKETALARYKAHVTLVRKSLGPNWKSDVGTDRDTEKAVNRIHTFINMRDKSSYIEVKVAENILYIDIH